MESERFQLKKVDGKILALPSSRGLAELMDLVLISLTLVIGWLIWFFIVAGRGQTPGKQMFGLETVSQGKNLDGATNILREFFKYFTWAILAGLILVLDIFMLLLSENYQTFHDKIFNTHVVYKDTHVIYKYIK